MNKEATQYLILSPEIQKYVTDNNIRLDDILAKAGQNKLSLVPDPTAPEGAREPVTILLGIAAVVTASTPILTRLIESMSFRPTIVKEYDLVPVTDAKGEVIRKRNGDPVLYWRERSTLIETQNRPSADQKMTAKVPGAIEIGFQHKSRP
jgi:hypothetical protein